MNKVERQISISDRIRQWKKKFPIAGRLRRKLLNAYDSVRYRRHIAIINGFPLFAPNSAGNYRARAELTVLAANQTFPFIAHFLDVIGRDQLISQMVEAQDFCAGEESKESAARLKSVLDYYGSDKADPHDYHYVYAFILKPADAVTGVLEIGLGTNNEDVVSHMRRRAKPGASLRAFRDFLPNATIYGADIDKRILFEEERIKTFFVDQTDLRSFDALGRGVGTNFDLIIDDGLHSPNANIAVLIFALSRLKPGGWLVAEDIAHKALPVWQNIAALLPVEYRPRLIMAKDSIAFAVQKT